MIDCLLVGFNDANFSEFCANIRAMGERSTAWRDIRSSIVTHQGASLRALDLLTEFRGKGPGATGERFHNMSFLSPAILYLGSFLKKHGYSFDYVNLFHLQKEELKEKLRSGAVRAVAVTTTLYVTPEPILEIVSFVRQSAPQVKIIVGGPYILKETADARPDEAERLFEYLGADFYVISSEGEQALGRILSALKGDGAFEAIANCAYRDGGGYRVNPRQPEENRLEDTVIDYRSFPRPDLGELVSIRTAISCPFSCAFCGFPRRAGRHRAAAPAHVEQELDALRALGGVTTITFLDDTFNVPRPRFKEILRMMIRNDYGFRWNSFLRSDHADAEIIGLMGQAGCEGVFLGVESGSDEMLERMRKSVRRRHFMEILPLLKEAGILSHMSLIVGFPGETGASVRDSISLVEATRPDFFRAQLWYCDPLTPIWQERQRYGIRGAGFNWSHGTMTAQTASDWVEEMFMSVSGSLWLPQHGFELWSVFYLQRQGMGLAAVKRFLASFNAAVKEQMMDKGTVDLSPPAAANLEAACGFGTMSIPHPQMVDAFSGAHYCQAASFWEGVFSSLKPLSVADQLPAAAGRQEVHGERPVNAGGLREVARRFKSEESAVALALFTAILSRLYGECEVSVAILWCAGRSFPLTFAVRWQGSFREHLNATATAIDQALRYASHLPYLLESGCHGWGDPGPRSRVQAGFFLGGTHQGLDPFLKSGQGIPLQLGLQEGGSGADLCLRTIDSFLSSGAAAELGQYLAQALVEIAEDQDRAICSLLAGEGKACPTGAEAEEDIEFQF